MNSIKEQRATMDKQHESDYILTLIENFERKYLEEFRVDKSIYCNRKIPIGALRKKDGANILNEVREADGHYTFVILKPNAVQHKQVVSIIEDIELAGFEIYAAKKKYIQESVARLFYAQHKDQPFFDELVKFLSSGTSYILILYKEEGDTIDGFRKLMGPADAVQRPDDYPNTLRARYAHSMTQNSLHASDSLESFMREVRIMYDLD